jgi:hypothetical protein
MADGGIWLQLGHKAGPEYVVHEAHIKRLLGEGARQVDDPRVPQEEVEQPTPAPSANELAMQAKIDQLEAMLKQLLTQKSEQADASTPDDGSTDSTNTPNDSRPNKRKSSI